MKLEFLPSGSPECPLIRLFAFNEPKVFRFRQLLESLSNGTKREVALHEQEGFAQVNERRLYLRVGNSDKGLRAVEPGVFDCVLSETAWDNMAGLVEPFCKPEASGYQWLSERGTIRLLLSRDGRW
jgi:hypothetical protein